MSFQTYQSQFASYIRNPEKNSLPANVKPERMAMYRELFFNNIEGFLIANFPVLHSLFTPQDWTNLVQDFFENHVCTTPHFSEIPEEFLAYLQNERQNSKDFPFLFELAHYEWVEMALSISHAEVEKMSPENLMSEKLAISPLACVLAYQFPVQKICAAFVPIESSRPTFLTVYRNENDTVQFLEITPLTFQLLQLIENSPEQTADFYIRALNELVSTIALEVLQKKGKEILLDFVRRGLIVTAPMSVLATK